MSTHRFSPVALGVLLVALSHPPVAAAQVAGVPTATGISAEFPFESKYVEALGSRMHYVDEGAGAPILFIHGNPTSSYLWRNIIPYVTDRYRAVAVDLIGMGRSDKPDIGYTYQDHARYLTAFIEALELRDLTLVVHDWGSVLGFEYAMNHEENVVGIAFMEAIIPPRFPAPNPMAGMFARFRTAGDGEALILEQNVFVEQILPNGVVRGLTEAEMNRYREPYPTPGSRLPTLMWPRELPAGGEPARNVALVSAIGEWMRGTRIPMLHIWARPGALNPEPVARELVERVPNLQSTFVGEARHYLQEDQPEMIGRAIADWRRRLDRP